MKKLALLLLAIPVAAFSATLNSIQSSANFGQGFTAPGSLNSAFGNFNLPTMSAATYNPYPSTLGGGKLLINGLAVPLLYVSPSQINFQVPYEVRVGVGSTYQVLDNSGSSNILTYAASATAIVDFQATCFGAQVPLVTDTSYKTICPTSPVLSSRQFVFLWPTGGGQTSPAQKTGYLTPPSQQSVFLAPVSIRCYGCDVGQNATVAYAGAAPGELIDQIVLELPEVTVKKQYTFGVTVGTSTMSFSVMMGP